MWGNFRKNITSGLETACPEQGSAVVHCKNEEIRKRKEQQFYDIVIP